MTHENKPNIVLVHGAWGLMAPAGAPAQDLQAEGHNVTAPQFPLMSLTDDVDKLRHVLHLQDGTTVSSSPATPTVAR